MPAPGVCLLAARDLRMVRSTSMRILYLDAFSGIAGDMLVGALLDAGAESAVVDEALSCLPLRGFERRITRVEVNGIGALRFEVVVDSSAQHAHRTYGSIREMLAQSSLAPSVRELAIRVFTRLAEAEARVHGVAPEDVVFHEVGAIDSIVDVVAGSAAVNSLSIDAVFVAPLPLGRGLVSSRHGPIPAPAPATLELLKGFPVRFGDGEGELVTPTGAAFVAALASSGAPPQLRPERTGYGAGRRQLTDRPNVLRVVVGAGSGSPAHASEMVILECNLDDITPEIAGHAVELLRAAGALDAWLLPAQMKKGRPGILLQCLSRPEDRERFENLIARETTTLGVRSYTVRRAEMPRERRRVETPYGPVSVKVGRAPDGTLNLAPEFEACRELAARTGVPVKEIYQAAIAAAHEQIARGGEEAQ